MVVSLIERIYALLWGDLIHVPLPGGDSVGISLLIILLIPTGIYFTVRTKVLPLRLFPDMTRALMSKKENKDSLSTFQTLIVSTATRVGMGNLVGVVAAISAGGAGAVFWMWVTALIGSSTAFVEATLAQIHKEKDPLYGNYIFRCQQHDHCSTATDHNGVNKYSQRLCKSCFYRKITFCCRCRTWC